MLLLYIGTAYGLARLAESASAGSYPEAKEIASTPVPAIPVKHRVLVMEENLYRVVTADGTVHEVPRNPPGAIVEAALASESIRGYANWLRFPLYTVEEAPDLTARTRSQAERVLGTFFQAIGWSIDIHWAL